MDQEIRRAWADVAQLARARSVESIHLRKFLPLRKEQASRAVYFCEMAKEIESLGLLNAFERSALSVEPTHPVPPQRLGREIDKLRGLHGMGARHLEQRLSLVSLPMLASIAPSRDVISMLHHFREDPLILLDPLYGFAFFRQDDRRFRNHCLAIDFWSSRLQSMPQAMSAKMWERRADNMLSGGALAGRFLFREIVPDETNSLAHIQVPEICIRSASHLGEVIDALNVESSKVAGVKLWFRGQSRDYQVPDRSDIAQVGIAPYSNISESDLTPSLYRRYDGYLDTFDSYEGLILELAEWVGAAKKLIPEEPSLLTGFVQQHPHAISSGGLTSFQRGLLLQQYGAPSAYLDITSDSRVAAWFATHQCKQSSTGVLEYKGHVWSSSDRREWPTIFVFPLVPGVHPFLELDSILPSSKALRPRRQSCGLLGGAGNLARNYCARYLGLKLRLEPGFSLGSPLSASYLFPPDCEDNALAYLKSAGFDSSNRGYPVTQVLSP